VGEIVVLCVFMFMFIVQIRETEEGGGGHEVTNWMVPGVSRNFSSLWLRDCIYLDCL